MSYRLDTIPRATRDDQVDSDRIACERRSRPPTSFQHEYDRVVSQAIQVHGFGGALRSDG